MHFVVDQDIPFLKEWLAGQVELTSLAHQDISPDTINHSDALVVRSVTPVNAALLSKHKPAFIAAACAGFNHIDSAFLEQHHIAWAYAPGCNASTVTRYVLSAIDALPQAVKRVGIVGMGHIGSAVSSALVGRGIDVVPYDPPRARHDAEFDSAPLSALSTVDMLCFHSALTSDKPILDASWVSWLPYHCVILNAARGGVVDEAALLSADKSFTICLDVFQHEPFVSQQLLPHFFIATPHIAGYSQVAKFTASKQVYEALRQRFNLNSLDFTALEKTLKPLLPLDLLALTEDFKHSMAVSQDQRACFHAQRRAVLIDALA